MAAAAAAAAPHTLHSSSSSSSSSSLSRPRVFALSFNRCTALQTRSLNRQAYFSQSLYLKWDHSLRHQKVSLFCQISNALVKCVCVCVCVCVCTSLSFSLHLFLWRFDVTSSCTFMVLGAKLGWHSQSVSHALWCDHLHKVIITSFFVVVVDFLCNLIDMKSGFTVLCGINLRSLKQIDPWNILGILHSHGLDSQQFDCRWHGEAPQQSMWNATSKVLPQRTFFHQRESSPMSAWECSHPQQSKLWDDL